MLSRLVAVIPLLLASCGGPESDSVRRVTVDEVREALDAGRAVVVDVRSVDSYEAGHIKGALSIPEAQIEARSSELPRDKLIVTYCS